jgi:hypothetical protein
MRPALAILLMSLALGGCQSSADPFCRAHNAAEFAPTAERFRTMSPGERRDDSERFNALARRCGWEP